MTSRLRVPGPVPLALVVTLFSSVSCVSTSGGSSGAREPKRAVWPYAAYGAKPSDAELSALFELMKAGKRLPEQLTSALSVAVSEYFAAREQGPGLTAGVSEAKMVN